MIKNSIRILKELVLSTASKTFYILDLLTYLLTLVTSLKIPLIVYILLPCIGLVISAIERVMDLENIVSANKIDMPLLAIHLRKRGLNHPWAKDKKSIWGHVTRDVFRIRNSWDKPVKDIVFKPIYTGPFSFLFAVDGTNVLEPGEERDLILKSANYPEVFPASLFKPQYANKDYLLEATFSDGGSGKYHTIFNLGKSLYTKSVVKD